MYIRNKFLMMLAVFVADCCFVACGDSDDESISSNKEITSGGSETQTDESESCVKGNAIDLGLSVKWADRNIGAETTEEQGGFYAWGETEEKEDYSEIKYTYYDASTKIYINIGDDISGTDYDVATVKWGGNWRIPTKEEMRKLCEKCTWKWTVKDSLCGMSIVGPNGNSIFLPAAGDKWGTVHYGGMSRGNYWTSTANETNTAFDYDVSFSSVGISDYKGSRYTPVRDKQII